VLVRRIRKAAQLVPPPDESSLTALLAAGEGARLEFKQRLSPSCAKAIAAFLNSYGGTLLVGVADNGSVRGLSEDGYSSTDDYSLRVHNLVRTKLIGVDGECIDVVIESDPPVCRINVRPSGHPIYFRPESGAADELYSRRGPSTERLDGRNLIEFVRRRFGAG
jgi:predicted HTH transcriptional regulator